MATTGNKNINAKLVSFFFQLLELCRLSPLRMTFMTTFLFFIIVFIFPRSGTALSFNYTSFNGNPNITCERAYIRGDGVIQLTSDSRASIGRATYTEPMQLWDNSTGNVTDFSTYFSFIIDSQNRTGYGDGIAFFLAPVGSAIPPNLTKGGPLGLTTDEEALNSTDNPFVAVEFDVYQNRWDPPGTHLGIDINSLVSVANISWMSDVRDGKTNEAWINYNSKTKNLSVVVTGFRNDTTAKTRVLQSLSSVVDFKTLLPPKVVFGFSASTGNASAAHIVTAWNFSSSLADIITPSVGSTGNNKMGLVIGLCVGGVVCFAGLIWFILWRKSKNRNDDDGEEEEEEEDDDAEILNYMTSELQMGSLGPRKFTYSELAKATDEFKAENKLGEGGFGGVYKGLLKSSNSYVAVKRISSNSKQGFKEYASEVNIISRLRHRNLVQLIGWCHEKRELLLVYEFMPNGSLDSHLFKGKSMIAWEMRYKIARGLASALLYLHEEWEQIVVHRDIKSSNIMLDSEFNVKLGDFGLARFVDHVKGAQTTVLAGTMGYMAPECAATFRASKESDVYGFGVVCLELACGRKAIEPRLVPENQVVLVEWVSELHRNGEILKAADPMLCGDFNEEQMQRLMTVGLACTLIDTGLRPSARQSIHLLDFTSPSPQLPVTIQGAAPSPGFHADKKHTSTSTENTNNSSHFTASSSVSTSSSLLCSSR